MTADDGVFIRRATPDDVDGILALQNANLPDRGGTLSAAFSADWFVDTIADMPVIVAVRDEGIVGFLVSANFSAHAHVPIVQALRRAYAGTAHSYLYGPICVAAHERGSRVGRTDVRRAAPAIARTGRDFVYSPRQCRLIAGSRQDGHG